MTAPLPQTPHPARSLLAVALPFYGLVAAFAVGYALFSSELAGLFGEDPPTTTGLGLGVAFGAAVIVLSRVASHAWTPMRKVRDMLVQLVGPLTAAEVLALGLASGFAEELLFRGALWPMGLVATTLLFGLLHVLPRPWLWAYPVFATAVGLLLGLLREGSKSLWPPIVAHVTINVVNLAWISRLARLAAAGEPLLPLESGDAGGAAAPR